MKIHKKKKYYITYNNIMCTAFREDVVKKNRQLIFQVLHLCVNWRPEMLLS